MNTLARPLSNGFIWLLTTGVVLGLPASAFVYYPLLQGTGTLPTDADSIAIPMFASVVYAILLAPIAFAITYICVRGRASTWSLIAWRKDGHIFTIAVTAFFIVPVVALCLVCSNLVTDPHALPIDRVWIPYGAHCALWCLTLRGAALGDRYSKPQVEDLPRI